MPDPATPPDAPPAGASGAPAGSASHDGVSHDPASGALPEGGAPDRASGAEAVLPPALPAAPDAVRLTAFERARLEEARRQAATLEASLRAAPGLAELPRRPTRWLALAGGVAVAALALALLRPTGEPTAAAAVTRAVAPEALAAPAAVAAPGADARPAGTGAPLALDPAHAPLPDADPAHPTWGRSRDVFVRLAMPGQVVDFPLAQTALPGAFTYGWVRIADGREAVARQPLRGSVVLAPAQPGIYRLLVARRGAPALDVPDTSRRVIASVTVAVLTPFAEKVGPLLNGYRLGRWPMERWGGERPQGFIEVVPQTAELRLTPHLRLRDFITHDGQSIWPKYVAMNPLLLDKLELVTAELAKLRGLPDDDAGVTVSVHSGFRTPLHNSGVEGSAFNSRHQYGDALDVAVDADGDGRFTQFDSRLVALAAEMVERRHPELVGGLGIYLNAREPYVHVDTRGRKARWWR